MDLGDFSLGIPKEKFSSPIHFEKVVPFLFGFPTNLLVDSDFSVANDVIRKKCNLLLWNTEVTYPYHIRAGYDTRSIFKRSLTGLNSEFSVS